MIKMTGEVNREDIDRVCTAAARAIDQWTKIRLLITLEDFTGCTEKPLGDGLGFVPLDGENVDKLAVVGERTREDVSRIFPGESLPAAAVNYFLPAERDQAVMWIVDGL